MSKTREEILLGIKGILDFFDTDEDNYVNAATITQSFDDYEVKISISRKEKDS